MILKENRVFTFKKYVIDQSHPSEISMMFFLVNIVMPWSHNWTLSTQSFPLLFFSLLLFFLIFFTKIILLLLFYYIYFFMKIMFIFSCSGMFRNVPCSGFYRRPFQRELKWRHLEQQRLRSSFKMAWGRTFFGVALKRRWRFGHDACTTKLRKVDRPLRCY